MEMSAKVITMNPQSARFEAFKINNQHLKYDIFMGVSGKNMSRQESVDAGFVTPELAATDEVSEARLGTALSHFSLWLEILKTGSSMLIMEDDVMTHPDLWAKATSIPDIEHKDIVLFTCNMNATLVKTSPEGVSTGSIFDPKNPHPDWIRSTLAKTDLQNLHYSRLRKAFGLCCYLVTPRGAKKLVEQLFPLRTDGVFVPFVPHPVMQAGLDRRLNALYEELDAFIATPFLAYTPHDNEFAPK
jgi:GR25 family glycosyltransferase involved in LPS biosynthesis